MNVLAIKNFVGRRPFVPFTIVMSSGDRYDVRHPENVAFLKEALAITPATPSGNDVAEVATLCSYLHIAILEPEERSQF